MLQLVVGGVDNFDVFFKVILVGTRNNICRILYNDLQPNRNMERPEHDSLYEAWEVLANDRRF